MITIRYRTMATRTSRYFWLPHSILSFISTIIPLLHLYFGLLYPVVVTFRAPYCGLLLPDQACFCQRYQPSS